MKTSHPNLPDSVREYLGTRGYRQFQIEYPDFGGIILYLRTEGVGQEAAYYISKPSTIELVTSEELRRILDLLEGSGIPLRYAFSTSPFSEASRELGKKHGISLRELEYRCSEITQPDSDHARAKRRTFRLGWPFANGTGQAK